MIPGWILGYVTVSCLPVSLGSSRPAISPAIHLDWMSACAHLRRTLAIGRGPFGSCEKGRIIWINWVYNEELVGETHLRKSRQRS